MQFTTLALSALSVVGVFAAEKNGRSTATASAKVSGTGVADAQSTASAVASGSGTVVHVVTVGARNGSLSYSPNEIVAAKGDMVQFQFMPVNHTVTQSTFDAPCVPIQNIMPNVTGIFSGFMPTTNASTTTPTYTIMVTATTPMWFYCSQAKHCQNGMVMAINVNTAANATRSLANYALGAKSATANLAPGQVAGGVSGSNSTASTGSSSTGSSSTGSSSTGSSSTGSSSSDSGTSGSGSGTSTGTGSDSSSSSPSTNSSSAAGSKITGTSGASSVRSTQLTVALGAIALTFFL